MDASDTRARVRDIALKEFAAGRQPSVRGILRQLGRGSPNTVVDEIRKIKKEIESPDRHEDGQSTLLNLVIEKIDRIVANAGPKYATAAQVIQHKSEMESEDGLRADVNALKHEVAKNRAWMKDEIDKAYERYEAVQKQMMLVADQARQQANYWRDLAKKEKEDSSAWIDALEKKVAILERKNSDLAAKAEALAAETEARPFVARR